MNNDKEFRHSNTTKIEVDPRVIVQTEDDDLRILFRKNT